MAVVTRYSSCVKDPTSTTQDRIPAEISQGHVHQVRGTLELVNGDSNTSKVLLASLPSNVRMGDGSKVYCDAIAGFTVASIGTIASPQGLMANTDLHAGSAAGTPAMSAVDISLYDKPLWQQLGIAADPGGKIDIYLFIGANLTAGGTFTHKFDFVTVV